MRVALYARISTDETRQCSENQVEEIEQFCSQRKWPIVARFVENASGSLGVRKRPILARMFAEAHQGAFDAVVVFALDRLTREGIHEAFGYIQRLNTARVEFHSVKEPQFSTSGPAGDLLIAIAAWIAQQERERIKERIAAGLVQARKRGTQLGRRFKVFDIHRARDIIAEGGSLRRAATDTGIPLSTLRRRLHPPKPAKAKEQTLNEWKETAKQPA